MCLKDLTFIGIKKQFTKGELFLILFIRSKERKKIKPNESGGEMTKEIRQDEKGVRGEEAEGREENFSLLGLKNLTEDEIAALGHC